VRLFVLATAILAAGATRAHASERAMSTGSSGEHALEGSAPPAGFDDTSDEELRASLLREYSGKEIGFDILREETWQWPFIEKHYRAVIKQLKAEGLVTITPITSKTDRGLKQKDRICFLGSRGGGGWPKSQL